MTTGEDGGAPAAPTFFFIHLMKTAGTSFVFQLLQHFDERDIYPSSEADRRSLGDVDPYASIPRLLELSPARRANIRVYTGHFPYAVCELLGEGLVTLTLLREPVARTVSTLNHMRRELEPYRGLPLEAIYDDPNVFRNFVNDYQTRAFGADAIADRMRATAAPAEAIPTPLDDRGFARAKANLAAVDVIGLSEGYDEFVEALRIAYGWWPDGLKAPPRANVSPGGPPVSAAFQRRIVADNARDVEFYEYATELIRARRRRS